MDGQLPKLTIVIPVRNEERYIARTIHYLLVQEYPADLVEILVGVADSSDRTAEIVQEIAAREPRVRYFRNPYGLSSGARSLGAQMAGGEIVIYIDGHVYIDNLRLFLNTVELMQEKQVFVLSRPQFLETPENTFFQRAVALARRSLVGHGLDSTIYTVEDKYVDPTSSGATYRKEVFQRVGYFDLSFDACEDVEFNYRCAQAGYRSFTSMKLAVYYYPRPSVRALFRQMSRYGAGRMHLARKHPRTLSLGTLIPPLMTAGFPLLALAALLWRDSRPLFLAACLAYLGLIFLSSAAVAARSAWSYLAVLPVIYPTLHAGLGWGFLRALLASRTRH